VKAVIFAGRSAARFVLGVDRPSQTWRIAGLVVLACVLVALLRGQDSNWDLLNYHRYVAWAAWHGRLGQDLAAAGLQSYFNPSLDLPLLALQQHAPAWLGAVLLGAWHSGVPLAVALVARQLWPQLSWRGLALPVASGVIAPAFWGGLGNTMGDNASAVPLLFGLVAALRWRASRRPAWLLGAGLLLGLSVSLKLTNATSAVALGLALMLTAGGWRSAPRVLLALTLAGLAGFMLGGGWWFVKVWQQFGNPFFPQFGRWFANPLAGGGGVADRRFVADSLLALLLRPILMVLRPATSSEFTVLPLLWPLAWAVAWLAVWRSRRMWWPPHVRRCAPGGPADAGANVSLSSPQRLLLAYVLIAVLLWALVFGIYRYTVPIEPLLPMCMLLLLGGASGPQGLGAWASRWLPRIWWSAMAVTVLGGSIDWGHSRWAPRSFQADTGFLLAGQRPVVLVLGQGSSWVLPFLPLRARHIGLGGNFEAGPAYPQQVRHMAAQADVVVALLETPRPWRAELVAHANSLLDGLGWRQHEATCGLMARVIAATRPHAGYRRLLPEGAATTVPSPTRCELTVLPADSQAHFDKLATVMAEASRLLTAHGLQLQATACQSEAASVGRQQHLFALCLVRLTDATH